MLAIWPCWYLPFLTTNNDESNAVTDAGICAQAADGTYRVKPIPVHEVVRRRKLTVKLFGKRRTRWRWKRIFHGLEHRDVEQSSHYICEFVARR